MTQTWVSRGFFLILLACIAQSCLDNNCEDASSTTQTVKYSENNPGDITKFKWEINRNHLHLHYRGLVLTRTEPDPVALG